MGKIAIVTTSAPVHNGNPTGVWLEELASPYYAFLAAGHTVVVASIKGGPIPIDQGSLAEGFFTDDCKKFMVDAVAVGALCHSVPIADIKIEEYDALYMSGGHGCCVDYVDSPKLTSLIEAQYNAGKTTASVCHGPICFASCKKADGTPLVAGLNVTGFSNSEEAAVGQTDNVPFLIEARFKEQGGLYVKGGDWTSKVVQDGNLITGQNPQSSAAAAELVIAALKK